MQRRRALQASATFGFALVSGCFGTDSNGDETSSDATDDTSADGTDDTSPNGSNGDDSSTDSGDEDLIDANPEELFLPQDDVEAYYDELVGEQFEDDDFEWSVIDYDMFGSSDNTFDDADERRRYNRVIDDTMIGAVTNGVWVYDDVESAIEAFDDVPFQDGWGFEDVGVAADSIAGPIDEREVYVLFREANVVAGLACWDNEFPEEVTEEVAIDLAATMSGEW